MRFFAATISIGPMKPNPDEFAKEVLWQLALLRAEIKEVKLLTSEMLALQTGKPATEIQNKWREKRLAQAEKIFQRMAHAVGLEDQPIPNHGDEG